jgi:protein transport protein SEC24
VHTLCLPVASNVPDIIHSADQQCIVGLLAKMGVDRVLSSAISDAREAFTNAAVDILSAYATTQNSGPVGLVAPPVLQVLPTYIHALLRSVGFRADLKPSLDDRTHFFNQMKALPLNALIQSFYPDLYPIHNVLSAVSNSCSSYS